MNAYSGRHAQLYDIFYADKLYKEEASFVHQCLQQYSTRNTQQLLELACGTGEHALCLEKYGYQIVALDSSEDMLACAQHKATQSCSKIDFCLQDMCSLNFDKSFDAVICLFDSIGYVTTNEGLIQVLTGVHRHLHPDGLLIFEFWHAAAMLCHYEPVRLRRWVVSEGEILRISETILQHAQQLGIVTYSVYELHQSGTYSSFKETQVNRYFLIQEMTAILLSCGFNLLKSFAGFTYNENITEETWHVVVVAKKIGQ